MMESHPPHLKNKFLQLPHQTLHVCINRALFSFVHIIFLWPTKASKSKL